MPRRNSKGKEKAPEPSDLALNPSFAISSGDGSDDEGDAPHTHITSIPRASSPDALGGGSSSGGPSEDEEPQATTLSKSWVEEEGEVFRKGTVLLGPEELGEEGADINSEELKREVRTPQFSSLSRPSVADHAILKLLCSSLRHRWNEGRDTTNMRKALVRAEPVHFTCSNERIARYLA